MKRILITLISLTLILLTLAVPVFADGDTTVVVDLSDVTTPPDPPQVGNPVTVSGEVTITSQAESDDAGAWTWAEGGGWAGVNKDSISVEVINNYLSDSGVPSPTGSQADASQVYDWSITFTPTDSGDYEIWHAGWALAAYGIENELTDQQIAEQVKKLKLSVSPIAQGTGNIIGQGTGNTWSIYAGQFAACIGLAGSGDITAVSWVEGWQGKTLVRELVEVGTLYNGTPRTYKLVIPEGTVVGGYYGGRAIHLEIILMDGQPYFRPDLRLSKPAILYELVDGKWVEILSFTEVLNGKAS